MSNATSIGSMGSGGSGIQTITGDSGSVTGSNVQIAVGTSASPTASMGTASFNAISSTVMVLEFDVPNGSLGIGTNSLAMLSSGTDNTAYGSATLSQLSTSINNNAFGTNCLQALDSGQYNCAFGTVSGPILTSGSYNSFFGVQSAQQLVSGTDNCFFGRAAGSAYTGAESNNILVGSNVNGTVGESNVCRIGSGTGTGTGQLNTVYFSGIAGNTVSNLQFVTIDTTTGELGSSSSSSSSVPVAGVITNISGGAPAAGVLGENLYTFVPQSSQVSCPTNTQTVIAQVTLTPGIWQISANLLLSGALTGLQIQYGISETTSLTGNAGYDSASSPYLPNASSNQAYVLPPISYFISIPTIFYLVVEPNYSVGTAAGYGTISALRVG